MNLLTRKFPSSWIGLLISFSMIGSVTIGAQAADTPYRHTIVDSFAEGAGGARKFTLFLKILFKRSSTMSKLIGVR